MGYITYPRSGGADKDKKSAEKAIALIERLLLNINVADLNTLMVLVAKIGWGNLPDYLKIRLAGLLQKELFDAVKVWAVLDSKNREYVEKLTQLTFDAAMRATSDSQLSLESRINSSGILSVRTAKKKKRSRLQGEMLVMDNGMHILITAEHDGQSFASKSKNAIKNAYVQDSNIKEAQKTGAVTTYDPAAQYIDHDQTISNGKVRYDLEKIPVELLKSREVRRAVLRAEERPSDTYSKQKTQSFPGKEREHIIPHSCFTDCPIKNNQSRSSVPLRDGVGRYTEGKAITYPLEDSQMAGTEHRFMTIQEVKIAREFRAQGREGTLAEWLDKIEEATVGMFTSAVVRGQGEQPTVLYTKAEAIIMAASIRHDAEQQYIELDTPLTLNLSNKIADMHVGQVELKNASYN